MTVLNEEQQRTLEVADASIALRSGAGCGKTTVLTSRFLKALEPPGQGVGSIVALTFTEKAARELRDRVRRACRERLKEAPPSPFGDGPNWADIVRGMEAAPIGTFHGFCQELLGRYPVEAGVEPGFAIVDEAIAPSLRNRALLDCLRGWLAEGRPELIDLALEYGLDALRRSLADLIVPHESAAFVEWAALDRDIILDRWEQIWEESGQRAILARFAETARPALDLWGGYACTNATMNRRREAVADLIAEIEGSAEPVEVIAQIRNEARVTGGGGASAWESPAAYERVRDALAELRDRCTKATDSLAWDREASQGAAGLGVRFARLAVDARAAYDREKRRAGLLDFDDLLVKARDLLRGHAPRVRADFANAGDLLLVDEFQDTDPIQGEILRLLAGDDLPAGRLFLVGDPKQSIYRFRGARPRIFDEFRDEFPAAGHLHLTANFRSRPAVLDFVNALFAEAFDDPPLRAGGAGPVAGTEMAVALVVGAEDGPADPPPNVQERRRAEARRLASVIARRIASGRPILDRKSGRERPARAGDVAYLFRTLNDLAVYESALADAGLDFHVVGGSAFFAQQEIIDVINLLAAIDDPLDALSLAAVLRSPFFGVGDDGLYWLATSRHDPESPLAEFLQGFAEAGEIAALSAWDREAILRARRLFAGWRAARDRLPMADLLDRALAETGYEPALMGERLGERKRANVRKLVRLVRRFDLQGGWTLADVVERLREDLRKPPREDQAATSEEQGDSIRLMTVHQAKGLEFPIVVLPDLGREVQDDRASVAFDPALGVVIRPATDDDADPASARGLGPNLGWTLYRETERTEEYREAIRLLYVATTRAECELVLSSAESPLAERQKSPAMQLLAGRFDLATGRLRGAAEDEPPMIAILAESPARGGRPADADPGLGRIPVAELIEGAAPQPDESATDGSVPERLDLDPARWLPPTAARLDRLVRAIIMHPRFGPIDGLEALAIALGRRQSPAAPAGLRHRAVRRVADWIERHGPLARQVARSKPVERNFGWSLALPTRGRSIVVSGVADLVVATRDGGLEVVLLGDPAQPEPLERLRLVLSAVAVERAGLGTVIRGRSVPLHGDESGFAEVGFGADAVAEALAGALRSVENPPAAANTPEQ